MLFTRWMIRSALVGVAALVLASCQSLGPSAETPPSTDRAESAVRAGDHAGAARIFESLAQQNSGSARNNLLLRAASEYLAAQRTADAARVLEGMGPALDEKQAFERQMLSVEISLADNKGSQAWQQIAAVREPGTHPEAKRYLSLKERAALAAGRPLDAILAYTAYERRVTDANERLAGRIDLLRSLREAAERGVKVDPRSATDATVRGWLELGPLAANNAVNPTAGAAEIESWRTRYPNHPAAEAVGRELLGQAARPPVEAASHVALLLPISGRQASAATSVRDGFMTAYYQAPMSERPLIRVYDTSNISIAEAISRATQEGAKLIVGPLLREEVVAAANLVGQVRPPIVALNFLPTEQISPPDFYQFSLSPEEEARQVAQRILSEGGRRGIVLVPEGDWGVRVRTAFVQELQTGGGAVLTEGVLESARTDYSETITQALRLTDSRARQRRLESILGTKLEMAPRRRGDIDFIFAAGQVNIARQLRPQLRFHFAGDIPTYATSDAFEPDPNANADMEGLIFPDMPWMLGGDLADAVRSSVREAWPTGGPRRGRLFAFGFDAYKVATSLQSASGVSILNVDGLTGRLTVDSERRVHRELGWAQIKGGVPKPLAPNISGT